jgi:hypothetical protein
MAVMAEVHTWDTMSGSALMSQMMRYWQPIADVILNIVRSVLSRATLILAFLFVDPRLQGGVRRPSLSISRGKKQHRHWTGALAQANCVLAENKLVASGQGS